MTRHVILLAHGSRDERWKQPFQQLLTSVCQQYDTRQVWLAYMEMTEPTLTDVARQAVANGATALVVLPLFMASGGHLRHDVPAQIETLKQVYAGVDVSMKPPVGEHGLVQQAMASIIGDLL